MDVTTAEFFQAVRSLAGGNEDTAKTVSDYVEQTKATNTASLKDVFLTKDDKVELVSLISETKAELIKWMFMFWAAQIAATFGLFFFFLKH